MKNYLLVFLTFFFAFNLAYGQSDSFKYLELTRDQLKNIGFVFNEHGIFFRSELPKDKLNENYYITLGYFNNKYKNGLITTMTKMDELDTPIVTQPDTLYFRKLPALKLDYFIIKVVIFNGKEIYSSEYKNVETIPFFIQQSDGHFSSNNDLIFYLKATHSLIDKLAYVDKINEYIVK